VLLWVLDFFLGVVEEEMEFVLVGDLWKISFRLEPCPACIRGAKTTTVELEVGAKDLNILLDLAVVVELLSNTDSPFAVFDELLDTEVNSLQTCWLNSDSTAFVLIKGSLFCLGIPNNFPNKCFIEVDLLLFFPAVLGSGSAPLIVVSEGEMGGGGAEKKKVENRLSILMDMSEVYLRVGSECHREVCWCYR
jgi:hypothetical protein